MVPKKYRIVAFAAIFLSALTACDPHDLGESAKLSRPPNIMLILADDLALSDLGPMAGK